MFDDGYKILGELSDTDAAGVLGTNKASSGRAVGVEGRTASGDGYGLYTDDSAYVGSTLEASVASTDKLNGVATPDPEDGGQGIIDAIESHQQIRLKPGVYETSKQITLPNTVLIAGAGHRREQTVIRATDKFGDGAVMRGVAGRFDIPHLREFEIDANGNATHCLEIPDSNLDFILKQLHLQNAAKDGLRCIGSFNGLIEKCRIKDNGRDGVVFGDTAADTNDGDNDFRASSIHIHKCHIGSNTNIGVSIGSTREASTATPNLLITHSDCSSSETGIYFGRYGSSCSVIQADVESNTTGVQIGDGSLKSFLPRRINIVGGKWSGNTTNIHIQSGQNITLSGLSGSGSTDGLKIDANADGKIIEQNVAFDGPTTRGAETINSVGEPGTKVNPYRAEMVAQNLSTKGSKGVTDYRHHDGSDGNPVGLYRGDGTNTKDTGGGWVKVSDNSVTIG